MSKPEREHPSRRPHRPWPHEGARWHGPPFRRRGRPGARIWLFGSLLLVFGFVVLLFATGAGAFIWVLSRLAADAGDTAVVVWLSACGIALFLPMLAFFIASRTFRGITTPLADVMEAVDKVAAGDFSVRVPEHGRHNGRGNQFTRLTRSFNRMTAELSRADEQRRNLTADVAHELRTPLHIIQGNLEGILDGVYEPTPEHIEATLEETRLLARLVYDLHTLAQAEAGQLPLALAQVDVADLLQDVHTSFSGPAEARGIALVLALPDQPLTLRGDADRLYQVLSNLVANALRHTEANGRIQLQAAVRAEDEAVVLTVADTGEGIDPDDLPFIFDRFWRGDRARSHTPGVGGGLGLAIARQLVVAHNGRIAVSSTVGEGTTFTLSFPQA